MVGFEVKKARTALGLTQEKYARKTGLSQQLVSIIEQREDIDPRLSTVLALVNRGGLRLTRTGLKAKTG